MGLPTLSVPDGIVPEIRAIVTSIDVAIEDVTPVEQDIKSLIAIFLCSEGDDAKVRLYVMRSDYPSPHNTIIVLQPISRSPITIQQSGRLLKKLDAVLREHGAVASTRHRRRRRETQTR